MAEQCQAAAYLLASATDRIYANKASRIGGLGLRMDGFGLPEAIERFGIEQRSPTAGAHKAIRDSLRPQSEEEREILQKLLDGLQAQFVAKVSEGRGSRLVGGTKVFGGVL